MSAAAKPPGPPRLQVTVTEGERCHRFAEVEAPAEFVAAERAAVLRKYASRVKLRGFRKGKAPTHVLLRHYGSDIHEETIDRVVQKACRQALESRKLQPVSGVKVADLNYSGTGVLSFKASFEVRPEVALRRLGGFRIERPPVTVPDGALEAILERLRREHAVWKTAENGRPEPGDSVTVLLTRLEGAGDGSGSNGSRRYDLVLGEGQALPDIEDAIQTLATGGSDEFEIAFPDHYPDETRAGTRHRLKIELVSRRRLELPTLDDAFAVSIGDFEDLKGLCAQIGKDLERDARSRAEAEFRERLLDLVVEANPFEVPDSMVEAYTEAILADAGDLKPERLERLRAELRPSSELAVRRDLLVSRIVEEHGLRASEQEISARVREIARQARQPPSAVRARLRKSGGLSNIERGITDAKLFGFLMAQSGIEGRDGESSEWQPIHPTS